MFTYAMVSGVKQGRLDAETYCPVARNAWLGLASYLESDGRLRDVCDGTWTGDLQFYLDRPRITGDDHGQAPMLWTVAELMR